MAEEEELKGVSCASAVVGVAVREGAASGVGVAISKGEGDDGCATPSSGGPGEGGCGDAGHAAPSSGAPAVGG